MASARSRVPARCMQKSSMGVMGRLTSASCRVMCSYSDAIASLVASVASLKWVINSMNCLREGVFICVRDNPPGPGSGVRERPPDRNLEGLSRTQMNTPSRKQFMELITHFKLATEATKEAMASEYEHMTRQDAEAKRPITPMLDFCMQRAGTRERAEAIFNHVLKNSRISYWPNPEVAPHLRDNQEIKDVCSKHFIVPVKATEHLLVLCGCNPHDSEGPGAIWQRLAGSKPPFPVVALSEPERIRKALMHFA